MEYKNYIIKNIYSLIIVVLSLINLGLSIYSLIDVDEYTTDSKQISLLEQEKEIEEYVSNLEEITVDIKGQVKTPGVYVMTSLNNINDLINEAGGLKNGASTANINLSKKLTDQMVVIISSSKDLQNKTYTINQTSCLDYNIYNCKVDEEVLSVVENKEGTNITTGKVSINQATLEQLMTLSGIGEAKAKAIINYRNENGPFTSIEDLINVSGIGEAIFANIKENITL